MTSAMGSLVEAATGGRAVAKITPAVPERARSRGYQMEMFEESLKRNIIVTVRLSNQSSSFLI